MFNWDEMKYVVLAVLGIVAWIYMAEDIIKFFTG